MQFRIGLEPAYFTKGREGRTGAKDKRGPQAMANPIGKGRNAATGQGASALRERRQRAGALSRGARGGTPRMKIGSAGEREGAPLA